MTSWEFPKIGTPKWMVYKENPIKVDDLGLRKHPVGGVNMFLLETPVLKIFKAR